MADVSAQQIPQLGNLMTAFPSAEQTMANQASEAAYRNGPLSSLTQAQTGQAQAQTGLIGAQTNKAQLDYEMVRYAFDQAKQMKTGQNVGQETDIDPTETGVASSLNNKFYVDPAGNPQLLQMANAYAAAGRPEVAAQYEKLNDIMVKSQTSKNQNEARDIFQTASALSGSKAPLQALLSARPGSYLFNLGRVIASDPSKSPDEKNAAAVAAIAAASKYSHQYTGEELQPAGSQFVGKSTAFPVNAPPIGRTPGEQQQRDIFQNTPQTTVTGNRKTSIYPDLDNGPAANTPAANPPQPGTGLPGTDTNTQQLPGFSQPQSDFINNRPRGVNAIPSNSEPNAQDVQAWNTYQEQAKKLADATNIEAARSQDSITQIKRINALLQNPKVTLGPGSHEYSQLRTVLENWAGVPSGQAATYQILSKVLNASEMNDLLQQFHNEGAQVRLGAYESRLIMEKLAANPNLTKEAIQQMLQWQASDAQYNLAKTKVAGALIDSGKSVANFDKDYGNAFPKKDIVDSTLSLINPQAEKFAYGKAQGKVYTHANVVDAATKMGVPVLMLQHQLEQNGATVK
jgi:hypothetical protein